MTPITYRSLSSLTPVELKYEYYKDEELKTDYLSYFNGFTFIRTNFLENFQDITINKNTCFALTTAVELRNVFLEKTEELKIGKIPASVTLQRRFITTDFVSYNQQQNSFTLTNTQKSVFYISPIQGTNDVEIFVDNNFVQVEEQYPFKVILNPKTLDDRQINRQRFQIIYNPDSTLTIKTLTKHGYRYLCIDKIDNILRATGAILNNSIINDYIFVCSNISFATLKRDFTPNNPLVTYYLQPELEEFNKSLSIKKTINNIQTNFLLNFSTEKVPQKGTAMVNIANLKTINTPTNSPPPINNITLE